MRRFHVLPMLVLAAGCSPEGDVDHRPAAKVHAGGTVAASTVGALDPEGLSYAAEVASYGEHGRHVERIRQVPDHAMRFAGGTLLGGDRGEWGGELVFRDAQGRDRTLLEENVRAIHPVGAEARVFTGLAHLGMNRSAMYAVSPNGTAPPRIRLVRRFAVVPDRVDALGAGAFRLCSDTYDSDACGATRLVSRCDVLAADGTLRRVACPPDGPALAREREARRREAEEVMRAANAAINGPDAPCVPDA